MYKKILATSMVAASLFFTGCGEDSASCRFDVQNDMDLGNFDAAIAKLDGACASSFSASDRNFNLATAYMGKAGFGAIDVVNMVLDSNDGNDDAFSTLTRSVSENKNDQSLELLDKAQTYFLLSIKPDANVSTLSTSMCDTNVTDSRVENACFYVGFNQTFQATTTITYLTNDVDTLVNSLNDTTNTTETPLDMKASLDALAWATGTSPLPNNSVVSATGVTIKGVNYAHLNVDINDTNNVTHTFFRLAQNMTQGVTNSTVITDGYCTSDGNKTACTGIEDPTTGEISSPTAAPANICYACPVTVDGNNTQSIAELLVDTLNGGTDVLVNVADDEDIQESIDEFIQDITGNPNATSKDVNISITDILNYLNK